MNVRTKKELPPDDCIKEFMAAIVKQTASDYLKACKREKKYRDSFKNWEVWRMSFMSPWKRWVTTVVAEGQTIHLMNKPHTMIDCERFFTSAWGKQICERDPQQIMNSIRQMVGLEEYSRREMAYK